MAARTPDEWLDLVLKQCKDVDWSNMPQGSMAQIMGKDQRLPSVIFHAIYESYKLGRLDMIEELRQRSEKFFDDAKTDEANSG